MGIIIVPKLEMRGLRQEAKQLAPSYTASKKSRAWKPGSLAPQNTHTQTHTYVLSLRVRL